VSGVRRIRRGSTVLSQFAIVFEPKEVEESQTAVNGPPTDSFWSAAAWSRALESCGP